MTLRIYKAGEAAEAMACKRQDIDIACANKTLFAVDVTPNSSRRSWRIDEGSLLDWHLRGRPLVKDSAA